MILAILRFSPYSAKNITRIPPHLRNCVGKDRQRIQSGGKREKFTKASDSCTWLFYKYYYKHHLIVTFCKILHCYGLEEHTVICTSFTIAICKGNVG
jgi:hypothetical protein